MRANLTGLLRVTERLRGTMALADALTAIARAAPEAGLPPESSRLLGAVREASGSTADTHGFFYAGTIVSLYGALEQFIEGLVEESVRSIASTCPTYEAVPEQMLRQHLTLSTTALALIADGRYHGELKARDLVAGLQRMMAEEMPIRLSNPVFSQHSANFRWPVIRHMFERIGLSVAQVERADSLVNCMSELFPDEGKVTFVIDDLAQRRNEVSHGWEAEILSADLLRAYISVVEAFAESLFEVTASSVVKYVVSHQGQQLGRPDRLFRGDVAGYHALPEAVEIGEVIAIVGSGRIRCAQVVSMQQEGVDVDRAEAGTSTGLRLSKSVSGRNRLFVLPREAGGWI